MRGNHRIPCNFRWLLAAALLACLSLPGEAIDGYLTRRTLLQEDASDTQITAENVGRLSRLLENAESRAVFLFAADVELPSVVTVTTRRLTFRGRENNRPTIRCAPGEGGFIVRANQTVFENLIIQGCEQTALLAADEVEPPNPFEQESVPDEAVRLDITVRNVDFIGNTADDDEISAGAFVAMQKVHAELIGCRFERNTGVTGGAIAFSGDSLLVDECDFVRNDATNSGGAIFADRAVSEQAEGPTTTVTIANCTFTRNRALIGAEDQDDLTLGRLVRLETNRYLDFPLPTRSGGSVFVAGFGQLRIESSNFTGNSAVPAGGAVYLGDNGEVTIASCRFRDNVVFAPPTSAGRSDLQLGGALFVALVDTQSQLRIETCLFADNSASYGGGLHFVGPTDVEFVMENSVLRNNVATSGGGAAVFRNAQAPNVYETNFANNTAFLGGAILLTNGAGLNMPKGRNEDLESRFIGNVAHDGGAIFGVGGGTLYLHTVGFERNLVERNGGAVCYVDSQSSGELSIQEARMFRNKARNGGAIYLENVSSFSMTLGTADGNRDFVHGVSSDLANRFEKNIAVAGGAIYYRSSNLLRNNFQLFGGRFEDNRAFGDASLVHREPLFYPWPTSEDRRRPHQNEENFEANRPTDDQGRILLDPRSVRPCEPGGGGAICAVMSGISRRAPVSFDIASSNFTGNSATVGGSLLITTEPEVEWRARCDTSDDEETPILSSETCRSLSLRDLRFERNNAAAAGGAVFVSDLDDVFYSTEGSVSNETDFLQLVPSPADERFAGNTVRFGYGSNVATTAARLKIRDPVADETGLLLKNQSSGRATPLSHIEVAVVDALNQTISHGIVDSAFPIRAEATHPERDESIASGEVVSPAREGTTIFESLALTAEPGQYEVVFTVHENKVDNASGIVILRECFLGERYINQSSICEECPFEKFTFYDGVTDCIDCPANAICSGAARLIPARGYWHSSPFSVVMHECFHTDGCSYGDRATTLRSQRVTSLQEFYERFNQMQDGYPGFSNEEYSQCAKGYQGPLCGSCEDGYGHADGKACVKCGSRSGTAAVIFLLALWQLLFMAVTIRSALVSIRDMSQMMAIQQQQQQQQQQAAASGPPWRTISIRRQTSRGQQLSFDLQNHSQLPAGTSNPSQLLEAGPSAPAASPQTTNQQQGQANNLQQSVDYIISAQHVSETIKIFVNFFQVTAVAVNINLEWTESMKNMLATMNSVAGFSNGATFTSMTCLLSHSDEDRSIYGVVLRIAFPLALMVFVMVLYQVRWLFMRRSPNYKLAQCRSFLRSRTIIVFLVVSFFAYQSISEDLMGTVSCVELDAKEMSDAERYDDPANQIDFSRFSIARDRYWTEDTTVKCYSRSHTFLVVFLGVPGIAFFLAGVPLYLLIFLLRKRQRGELMELNVLNTYGFIYQNYEDMFVYWEVCILIRKALISAVVVFAYPLGANLQGIMALGVLIIALAFHLVATPFKYFTLNVLETCSLVVSIVTFYAGIVFNDEHTADSGQVLLSVIVIALNVLLAFIFCMTVYVYTDRCVVERLKTLGVVDIPKHSGTRAMLLISLLFSAAAKAVNSTVSKSTRNRAQRRNQRRARRARKSAAPSPPVQTVQLTVGAPAAPQDSVVVVEPDASSDSELN